MEYMPKVEQKLNFLGIKYHKMETPKRYVIQLIEEVEEKENDKVSE